MPEPGAPAREQAQWERIAELLGSEAIDELDWIKMQLRAYSGRTRSLGVECYWSIELAARPAGGVGASDASGQQRT